MIYFAYGSNLNLQQMRWRCPAAEPLGRFYMHDARLVFRGVADCVYEPGARCPGGLWRITPACERALDSYEGVGRGLYRKEFVDLTGETGGETKVLYYAMNSTGIMPPSERYLAAIRDGYRDFKLPLKLLDEAVKAAWDDKAPSFRERQRYRRAGRPLLARVPSKPVQGRLL